MQTIINKLPTSLFSRLLIKKKKQQLLKRHKLQAHNVASLSQKDLQQKVKTGCLAVQKASMLCKHVQATLQSSEEVGKADDSPVTVADFASQAVVAYYLQKELPSTIRLSLVAEETSSAIKEKHFYALRKRIGHLVNSFISEETTLTEEDVMDLIDLGASNGGPDGIHWVLDPIDGTRGFISHRQYSICLGLLDHGEAVLGILGCPNLPQRRIIKQDGTPDGTSGGGCQFVGIKGDSAYIGSLWEHGIPSKEISVEKSISITDARFMESYESRHSNHEMTETLARHLGIQKAPLRLDSQAKYGALSRGDAELFMRFPPKQYREKIWDHCAGAVIVEAAGGKISDGFGNKLDFSKGRYLDINCGIVAAPPEIHSQVISLIQSGIVQDY